MRLGILTQYYPPEVGAPQTRLSELAESLAGRGHDVTVLTALPSYPRGRIFAEYRGAVRREEKRGGVKVLRTLVYPTQSASFAPRMANYLSFAASSVVQAGHRLGRLDYLLTESP